MSTYPISSTLGYKTCKIHTVTVENMRYIAITQGDPAGIGPEIIVRSWTAISQLCLPFGLQPVVFGQPDILELVAKNLCQPQVVPVVSCTHLDIAKLEYGKISAVCGQAAFDSLQAAISEALAGKVAGIVTTPLHKESLALAGHCYPGHTEILADRCGVTDFGMMLYLGSSPRLASPTGLAVVHVTLHTAMRSIFDQITPDSVRKKIVLVHDFMRKMKGTPPKIGVCSLNPHAGEGGLFGDEEITCIRPGIELARHEGMDVTGPLPADTIMLEAVRGRFDAAVAMFHDQGHIALKLLDMYRSVNITLGLPIIRTSVAHGTAFDIAGRGVADPGSLIEAVRVAAMLV